MLKQRFLFSFLLLLLIFIASSLNINACSCSGRYTNPLFQPCAAYWQADAVFIGTVENISIKDGEATVSLGVEKSLRGAVADNKVEISTNANTASCGYPFKQSEKYFVYAGRDEGSGKLRVSLCSPTILFQKAGEDIEYLKALEAGETGARIYGSVSQQTRNGAAEMPKNIPLANIKITLETDKKIVRETATDPNGKYEFRAVLPGSYRIRADFPQNLRELRNPNSSSERYVFVDKNNPNRCSPQLFLATSLGSLAGTVSTHNNKDSGQQFVELVPFDENGKLTSSYFMGVWTDRNTGNYFFNPVPPGRYLVAVNPGNCPSSASNRNPAYGRAFYPGVTDAGKAEIVTVGESEAKRLGEFHLKPLEERLFSGVVLSADKKPLAGAKVWMMNNQDFNRCQLSFQSETITDESGRFQLKGYETYKYRIRAHSNADKPQSSWLYSTLVELPENGEVKNLEFIVSLPY